jgi:hypothetical protein
VLDLQLGRILDGDDPLVRRDERREQVEQRRLAGAGAAGDQDVGARPHTRAQEIQGRSTQRAQPHQVVGGQQLARELPDRQRRSVHRQRRDDRVDARAIGQARVHHRRGIVQPPADRPQDLVDDVQHVRIVAEGRVRPMDDAVALEVDAVPGVDHDLGDGRIAQQRLERAQPEHLVGDLRGQAQPVLSAQIAVGQGEPFFGGLLDRSPRRRAEAQVADELLRVELVDQLLVHACLQLHLGLVAHDAARARSLGPGHGRGHDDRLGGRRRWSRRDRGRYSRVGSEALEQ